MLSLPAWFSSCFARGERTSAEAVDFDAFVFVVFFFSKSIVERAVDAVIIDAESSISVAVWRDSEPLMYMITLLAIPIGRIICLYERRMQTDLASKVGRMYTVLSWMVPSGRI